MKTIFSFKRTLLGLALLFGMYGLAKLILRHDLVNGLWSLAVCWALCLGLLPRRFFEIEPRKKAPPNKRPLGLE